MKTLNINLFAGPGVGKTATALGLTWLLSMRGIHVEYVPEYPKRLFYEGRLQGMSQLEILQGMIASLEPYQGKVQVVVTDGPPLQSLAYVVPEHLDYLHGLLEEKTSNWAALNVLLSRDIRGKYQKEGRHQTEEEAIIFHNNTLAPLMRRLTPDIQEVAMMPGQAWLNQLADRAVSEISRLYD